MINSNISNSDFTGEVSGAFILSIIQSFNNTIIFPVDALNLKLNNIEPDAWYPYSYLINTLSRINNTSPSKNILFQAGINFIRIWEEQNPDKTMVNSGLDWFYKIDKNGFNSVTRGGNKTELGWCHLLSMDEKAGIAVYENVMPLLPDFLNGVFYGGASLLDDIEYVESEITSSEPYEPNPLFLKTILTLRFLLKSKNKPDDLDSRINKLEFGSTLPLAQEEIQSVIWQNKASKYNASFRENYINDLETIIREGQAIQSKYKEMALDFNSILDHSNDFFYIKDTEYRFRVVNHNFAKLTGHQHWTEIVGKTDFDVFPQPIAQMYRDDDEKVIKLGQPVLNRIESYPKEDGTEGWVKSSKLPVFDENGNILRMFGFSADITELFKMKENLEDRVRERTKELQEQAIKDSLTDLYNRRYFDQVLFSEFNRAKREKRSFVLAMLDIDFFKKYNDTYGHQAGDVVIQKIAQVLLDHTNRSGDYSFRTGGEEFAIITQASHDENYIDYFKHICKSIEDLNIEHIHNTNYHCVTISIGLIEVKNFENLNTDKLYQLTDQQLYKAKYNGRDQVVSSII